MGNRSNILGVNVIKKWSFCKHQKKGSSSRNWLISLSGINVIRVYEKTIKFFIYNEKMESVILFYKDNYSKIFDSEPWKSWRTHNENLLQKYGPFSIRYYSYVFDEVINTGIRKGRLSEIGYILICRIIRLINMAQKIPTDLFLFRGIKDNDSLNITNLKPGDMFNDKAISSKTLNPEIAKTFVEENGCCVSINAYTANSVPMILLEAKASYTVYHGSQIKGEYEMLTYPGEIFKVISVSEQTENKYLHSQITGFSYNNIESELLKMVDLSIDRDYRKFYETLFNLRAEIIAISALDQLQIDHYLLIRMEKRKLKYDQDFIIKIYRDFVLGNLVKVVAITGLKDFYRTSTGSNFKFSYESDGIIIYEDYQSKKTLFEKTSFEKSLYNGTFKGMDIPNSIQVSVVDIQTKPRETPERIQEGQTSEGLRMENQFNNYPMDVQKALYHINKDLDTVIFNLLGLNLYDTNEKKQLENLLYSLNTHTPEQLALSAGYKLNPYDNSREAFINRIKVESNFIYWYD